MTRTRIALTALASAAALAAAGGASGAEQVNLLTGTVGPGFTITLKDASGHKVTKVKPGNYAIRVTDKASIHDFHLTGPGVNKVITSVGFTGTKTVAVALKKGKYTYVCDPHAFEMKGSFTVG
jgi:plastocyanin